MRQLVSASTALLAAACFLGVFPTNLLSILCLLGTITLFVKDRPGAPEFVRPLAIGIGIFLTVRLLSAAFSPDPSASFKYVSKDWHMLLLLPGLLGILTKPPTWSQIVLIAVLVLSLGLAVLQLNSVEIPVFGLTFSAPSPSQTGAFQKQPLTLGGLCLLLLFMPALIKMPGRIHIALIALAGMLLLISGARGTWLAALAGGVVLAALNGMPKRKLAGLLVAIVIVFTILPTTRERVAQTMQQIDTIDIGYGSIGRRFQLWQGAFEMGNSALFGVGPGRYETASFDYVGGEKRSRAHAHNVPLNHLAESGWPGLLAWLIFWGALAYPVVRAGLSKQPASIALFSAFTIACMFEVYMYDAEVMTLFYLLWGHCLHLASQKRMSAQHEEIIQH